MRIIAMVFFIGLALAGCASTANVERHGSSYEKGMFAFEDKNYVEARRQWSSSVNEGEVLALNNLGYLLYYGLGGPAEPERAVALLDAVDADNVGFEVDVLPQQSTLLARPGAGEEGEGVVYATLGVGLGGLKDAGDGLGGKDRLLDLLPAAPDARGHRRYAHAIVLFRQRKDGLEVPLRPVGGV